MSIGGPHLTGIRKELQQIWHINTNRSELFSCLRKAFNYITGVPNSITCNNVSLTPRHNGRHEKSTWQHRMTLNIMRNLYMSICFYVINDHVFCGFGLKVSRLAGEKWKKCSVVIQQLLPFCPWAKHHNTNGCMLWRLLLLHPLDYIYSSIIHVPDWDSGFWVLTTNNKEKTMLLLFA